MAVFLMSNTHASLKHSRLLEYWENEEGAILQRNTETTWKVPVCKMKECPLGLKWPMENKWGKFKFNHNNSRNRVNILSHST